MEAGRGGRGHDEVIKQRKRGRTVGGVARATMRTKGTKKSRRLYSPSVNRLSPTAASKEESQGLPEKERKDALAARFAEELTELEREDPLRCVSMDYAMILVFSFPLIPLPASWHPHTHPPLRSLPNHPSLRSLPNHPSLRSLPNHPSLRSLPSHLFARSLCNHLPVHSLPL